MRQVRSIVRPLIAAAAAALIAATAAAQAPDSAVRGGVTIRPFDFNDLGAGGLLDPSDPQRVPEHVVELRSHQPAGLYREMVRSTGEVIAYATDYAMVFRFEDGLSSNHNIQISAQRSDTYVFSALARDILTVRLTSERHGRDHPYQQLRALVSLPPLVVHFVTRGQGRARQLAELAEERWHLGLAGTDTRRLADLALRAVSLDRTVRHTDVADDDAVLALRRGDIDGFAVATPLPAAAIEDLADAVQIGLVGVPTSEFAFLLESEPQLLNWVIPAHRYPNVEFQVTTFADPVGLYTANATDADAMFILTAAFWPWRLALVDGAAQPYWATTDTSQILQLQAPLHPGAERYYEEAGVRLPVRERPM